MPQAGQIIRAVEFQGRARVLRTSSQSLDDGSTEPVQFDTVVYDDSGLWDEVNHWALIPPGMGGLYSLTASISYGSNANGRRSCTIQSSVGRLASITQTASSDGLIRTVVSTLMVLDPGDTVWVDAFQTSGGSLNITGSSTNITHFALARIQPL